MSSANIIFLLYNLVAFCFFFLLWLTTSSTMFNRNGENRHTCFTPHRKSIQSVTIICCGFFICGFYYMEVVSFYSILLSFFKSWNCWNLLVLFLHQLRWSRGFSIYSFVDGYSILINFRMLSYLVFQKICLLKGVFFFFIMLVNYVC